MTYSKYHNKRVKQDGYNFDSKREAERYSYLKLLEKGGQISELEVHPRYPIHVNDVEVCKYEADFTYLDHGVVVVEDVKGMKTAMYKLKKKMMKAEYDIDIHEVS